MAAKAALLDDLGPTKAKRAVARLMPRASQTYPHLSEVAVLREMPMERRHALIDQCQIRSYDRATPVTLQGEPAPGMYLIAKGAIEVAHVSDEGNLSILHVAGPSETIGDLHALADAPCFCTCTAMPKTTLLLLPMPKLLEFAADPLFLRGVMRQALERLNRETTNRSQMSFWSVGARLAGHLLQLGKNGGVIRHSQSQLAALVGCSRQTINRVLGEMRADGLVDMQGGGIVLIDRECLSNKSRMSHRRGETVGPVRKQG